jgi:polysaccharide biosynthesis protein PslJ
VGVSVAVGRSLERSSILPPALIAGSVALLAVGVAGGLSAPPLVALVVLVTLATLVRVVGMVAWPWLIAALILLILFVPIRRYFFPVTLPFQLEPYRVYVAVLLVGWSASLLVDGRTRLRRTGLEGPIIAIVAASIASIVANPERVAGVSSFVDKKLMFLLSFVFVLYLVASVIRRLDEVDFLVKALVTGGGVVALFAIVEARAGFNVFDHLSTVIPFLDGHEIAGPDFVRYRAAKLRVFGSAEHPIAMSAAFVLLAPLAVYLARRYRQRRWTLCAVALVAACAATVSRTGIVMFLVVVLVFLWLRPRETLRLWPVALVALIAIKLVLPGTLGAIKQSFLPPGGLVAEQQSEPGELGSGRLADLGPAFEEWSLQPLLGQGFGTRVVDLDAGVPPAIILDNQWLGTLLETGAIGLVAWCWFFFRVVRRLGAEARRDRSERGWLLASLAAAAAAFAVGMLTYDAFSFIQVTFLVFVLAGLGCSLLAERPAPHAVPVPGRPTLRTRRRRSLWDPIGRRSLWDPIARS